MPSTNSACTYILFTNLRIYTTWKHELVSPMVIAQFADVCHVDLGAKPGEFGRAK
jgi:hypothetical protein